VAAGGAYFRILSVICPGELVMAPKTLLAVGLLLLSIGSPVAAGDRRDLDLGKVAKIEPKILAEVDRFNGNTRWSSKWPHELGGVGLLTTVYLDPVYVRDEKGIDGFYFRIKYSGYGWVFLDGSAVVLLGDGTRIPLQGPDSSDERSIAICSGGAGCIDEESLRLPVSQADFEKISHASRIEIRLNGRSVHIDGYFKEHPVAEMQRLLAMQRGFSTSPATSQP
jgi:hypothetical protein